MALSTATIGNNQYRRARKSGYCPGSPAADLRASEFSIAELSLLSPDQIAGDDPDKTNETIDDAGWLHSGDIAVLDDKGYCQIVGRLKDMLIRGGENIFPREIEEYLFQHPKVEAAEVVGVPDAKYGKEICAWIQLRAGESATADEIREFCRERIAHYKIPRYVLFVDDFPMTITGKVQKYKMRERSIDMLGLA